VRSNARETTIDPRFVPDYIYGSEAPTERIAGVEYIVDFEKWQGESGIYPAFTCHEWEQLEGCNATLKFLSMQCNELSDDCMARLKAHPEIVLLCRNNKDYRVGECRAFVHSLMNEKIENPVVFLQLYTAALSEDFQLQAAMDMGPLIIDGFCDGIALSNTEDTNIATADSLAFGILQAGRVRTSKTEYISCPGCGRTLFNLQEAVARVKAATAHLTGLKIAVMGCIVNGPGEMADADYGYVGAGRGKVSLYKGKECVAKNIPEEEAVDRLLALIQ
jgi:(E)-4-hydroxy-3-methylbut-2-enyl-diphosphate synthase